jgi:hypothetical protein
MHATGRRMWVGAHPRPSSCPPRRQTAAHAPVPRSTTRASRPIFSGKAGPNEHGSVRCRSRTSRTSASRDRQRSGGVGCRPWCPCGRLAYMRGECWRKHTWPRQPSILDTNRLLISAGFHGLDACASTITRGGRVHGRRMPRMAIGRLSRLSAVQPRSGSAVGRPSGAVPVLVGVRTCGRELRTRELPAEPGTAGRSAAGSLVMRTSEPHLPPNGVLPGTRLLARQGHDGTSHGSRRR